jgi:hypothetical protein
LNKFEINFWGFLNEKLGDCKNGKKIIIFGNLSKKCLIGKKRGKIFNILNGATFLIIKL